MRYFPFAYCEMRAATAVKYCAVSIHSIRKEASSVAIS
jgi:hypothetical protein